MTKISRFIECFASIAQYDHAHNARIDQNHYAQRSMTETVNSAMKRPFG